MTRYSKCSDSFGELSTVVAKNPFDVTIAPEEGYCNHGLMRALVLDWVAAL